MRRGGGGKGGGEGEEEGRRRGKRAKIFLSIHFLGAVLV